MSVIRMNANAVPGSLEDHRRSNSPARLALEDRESFARFYEAHHRAVFSYLLRRVGDPQTAEDLCSEVFLAALKWRRTFRDRGAGPRPWLFRIAASVAARWWKQQGRRRPAPLEAEHAASGERPRDHELAAALRRALARLPEKSQLAVSLHHLEGWRIHEIAAAMECRPGAVKSRLLRARQALRAELRKEGIHDASQSM